MSDKDAADSLGRSDDVLTDSCMVDKGKKRRNAESSMVTKGELQGCREWGTVQGCKEWGTVQGCRECSVWHRGATTILWSVGTSSELLESE